MQDRAIPIEASRSSLLLTISGPGIQARTFICRYIGAFDEALKDQP
jgi:hypothetical protein